MSKDTPKRNLNYDRLLDRIEELGAIGATPEGGVRRIAATDADKDGRDKVVSWMNQIDLKVEIDQIGNIFATLEGTQDLAAIMIGSHIDTVGNGGKLDGPYGVLAGLEVAASFRESHIVPSRPITIAVFTNEEGVRFQPDMMGSLVFAGGLPVDKARAATDRDGVCLGAALDHIGYSGPFACDRNRPAYFLELHIEQGPILEMADISLGAVESVQGIFWTGFTIRGQANHAGTTPMHLRKDAGIAAARIALEARNIAHSIEGQVATAGQVDLKPNLINVVAGEAYITIDFRNADRDKLIYAQTRLENRIIAISKEEGVDIDLHELVRFDPVIFDNSIVKIIEIAASEAGHTIKRMTSGAGHDAQMMARICPSAMIFTPSIDGVSHNPKEKTHQEDLKAGLDVLSRTIGHLLEK